MALFLISMAIPLTLAEEEGGNGTQPVSLKSLRRPIGSLQYFHYLRYNEGIDVVEVFYNKSVELGVDEKILELPLEYKELTEKEYELAWRFGHPPKRSHSNPYPHEKSLPVLDGSNRNS